MKGQKFIKNWKPSIWITAIAALSFVLAACGSQSSGDRDEEWEPTPTTQFHLNKANSCDSVRKQVTETITEEIVKDRYLERRPPMAAGRAEGDSAQDSPSGSNNSSGSSEPDDYTETNTQVEGVDESDIIKTDGTHIYAVREDELLVLKSWPPEETEILARYDLSNSPNTSNGNSTTSTPRKQSIRAKSLFLRDNKVAVFSSIHDNISHRNSQRGEFNGTRITILDVSDPTDPTYEKQLDIEGEMVTGRMIGGDVYIVSNSMLNVTSSGHYRGYSTHALIEKVEDELPERPSYDAPQNIREARAKQARPQIRAAVENELSSRDIEEMFPRKRIYDSSGGVVSTQSMYDCEDIYLPPNPTKLGILSVSHFDLDTKINIQSQGLMARGSTVYSSQDNLYVAMSNRLWWWGWGPLDNESHIHKFSLNGPNDRPQYKASGKVDGWLLNQFSMSEKDGHLRVATTDNQRDFNPRIRGAETEEEQGGNHVIILEQNGSKLERVGAVEDMAPGEVIRSVRFMGNKGYVVTFERIDPLFTLDLSQPENPKKMGELKIQGFSTYMHPLGDSHLLTIGRAGTQQGATDDVQLQIFDVSDMKNPRKAYEEVISMNGQSGSGRHAYASSEAMWEHHAFTYDPDTDMLAVPLNIYNWSHTGGNNFSGLLLYKTNPDIGFDRVGYVDHTDLNNQNRDRWWTSIRRSTFMTGDTTGDGTNEHFVYSFSRYGLKVNELFKPSQENAAVQF